MIWLILLLFFITLFMFNHERRNIERFFTSDPDSIPKQKIHKFCPDFQYDEFQPVCKNPLEKNKCISSSYKGYLGSMGQCKIISDYSENYYYNKRFFYLLQGVLNDINIYDVPKSLKNYIFTFKKLVHSIFHICQTILHSTQSNMTIEGDRNNIKLLVNIIYHSLMEIDSLVDSSFTYQKEILEKKIKKLIVIAKIIKGKIDFKYKYCICHRNFNKTGKCGPC